jgi:hypothetical protein
MAVGRVLDWHSDLAESFGPHTGLVECNGAHVPVLVVTNPHVLTTDPPFHGHGGPPSRPKSTAPRRWQPESKDPEARPIGPAWWPEPGTVLQGRPRSAFGGEAHCATRLSEDFWSEQSIRDASYPLTVQLVEVHNAISAGSTSNFTVHVVRHLTVTPQGDATAAVDAVRAECRS